MTSAASRPDAATGVSALALMTSSATNSPTLHALIEHADPAADRFCEWSSILANEPLRQGDVIRSLSPDGGWQDHALVLTADCDLANSKHSGWLTCVPILTVGVYLTSLRIPGLVRSSTQRAAERMVSLSERRANADGGPLKITQARMESWITEASPHDILLVLKLGEELSAKATPILEAATALATATSAELKDVVPILARVRVALNGGSIEKSVAVIASELASHLKKLPGDAFFLNFPSPDLSDGAVVYLRRAFGLEDSCVVTGLSRVLFDAKYVRTARLSSPYVYAISQQFGNVYSSIGMPVTYENSRESAISGVSEILKGDA